MCNNINKYMKFSFLFNLHSHSWTRFLCVWKWMGIKSRKIVWLQKQKLSCNRDRKSNLQLIFCGKIHVKINIYFMYYIYLLIRREATTTNRKKRKRKKVLILINKFKLMSISLLLNLIPTRHKQSDTLNIWFDYSYRI